MVNQETGVRGYALGQDDAFLEPYNIAELLGGSAQSTLRKYLLGHPDLLAELGELDDAIDDWRTTVAEPIIAAVQAGDDSAVEAAGSPEAKAAFDRVRAASNQLTNSIDEMRTPGRRGPRARLRPTSGSRSPSARRSCSSPVCCWPGGCAGRCSTR